MNVELVDQVSLPTFTKRNLPIRKKIKIKKNCILKINASRYLKVLIHPESKDLSSFLQDKIHRKNE